MDGWTEASDWEAQTGESRCSPPDSIGVALSTRRVIWEGGADAMISVTPFGPHAVRLRHSEAVTESSLERGLALDAYLESKSIPGCIERIPGFTTLLLRFDPSVPVPLEKIRDVVSDRTAVLTTSTQSTRVVPIPTTYGGPDLQRVADHARLRPEEVVERHCAGTYRVHCLGFAPGFPYLGGLDPALLTPRLATPRTRVPAGSVAIGGEHAGIYSVASPGGWNLIGRTSAPLFNPVGDSLEALFLLRPGDQVRFVAESNADSVQRGGEELPDPGAGLEPMLRIVETGMGLTLQDLGRPGFARFGVPPSGCMDPELAAVANRLVENPASAPVLEMALQGQRFEVLRDGWLAVGGDGVDGQGSRGSAFRVRAGETLSFPPAPSGVWRYLAVPGGWVGRTLMGSRSGGIRLGEAFSLKRGDVLNVAAGARAGIPAAVARRTWAPPAGVTVAAEAFPIWPGPQWDEFTAEGRERFFQTAWVLSSQCDRVGYRLQGDGIAGVPMPGISEPVLPGSIQVPPDGRPIVTMPDGPTLGGYPKIGWMDPATRARLSQCRAGQGIRFVPAS